MSLRTINDFNNINKLKVALPEKVRKLQSRSQTKGAFEYEIQTKMPGDL